MAIQQGQVDVVVLAFSERHSERLALLVTHATRGYPSGLIGIVPVLLGQLDR